MTEAASVSAWLLLGPVMAAGFFLPGLLTSLRAPTPGRALTSFLASLLLLHLCVLICDLAEVPIELGSLSSLLGTAALGGWLVAGRPRLPTITMPRPRMNLFSLAATAPVGIALGIVVAHAVLDPLAGWDNAFRWDHLARLIAATGRLDFYPPVTTDDFFIYAWCDGIPPLIPVSNLWIYQATRSNADVLIAGRVALELALCAALVWKISRRLWGDDGARFSLLLLACSGAFLFSIGLAQETGLGAVMLLLLAWLLIEYRHAPTTAIAAWAGLAAGGVALVRDYNIVFIPITAGLLLLARAPRSHIFVAIGTACAAAAPWYVRNAWITGNPLFAHDLGLFPAGNAFHSEVMRALPDLYTVAAGKIVARVLPALALGLGPAVLLAPFALRRAPGAATILASLAGCVLALWWVSVPQTAGGWTYSLRVVGGAAPLFCVLGGWAGSFLLRPGARRAITLAACALLAVDATRRSRVFLHQPDSLAWPRDGSAWRLPDASASEEEERNKQVLWRALAEEARGEVILCDQQNDAAAFALHPETRVAPLFSPLAKPITEVRSVRPRFSAVMDELLANHVRFVVLTENSWTRIERLRTRTALGLFHLNPPTIRVHNLLVYDLRLLREEFVRRGLYDPAPGGKQTRLDAGQGEPEASTPAKPFSTSP